VSFGVADPARPFGEPAARPENVRALERGLAIIQAFDAEHPALTLSDAAKQTGLPRAVVRRFLYTLEDLGYVRTDGKTFSLRPRVLRLGYAYLASFGLPGIARMHLEDLVEHIGQSAALAVLDGPEVVYIAQVRGPRLSAVSMRVGERFPAHATSAGRVLLAGQPKDALDDHLAEMAVDPTELRAILDEVRESGWAMRSEDGLPAIAVPVCDRGEVVAALTVHAVQVDGLVPVLRRTAEAIEQDLLAAARR
jgi:IclR family pca regulon transcriptional regulator